MTRKIKSLLFLVVSALGCQDVLAEAPMSEFTARVESVEILDPRNLSPDVRVVHPDPRWLLTVQVLRSTATGVIRGEPFRLAIHCPIKTFGLFTGQPRGQVFRFVLHDGLLSVSAARAFDRVPGWEDLRWNMSPDEVRAALKSMGRAFTEEEATGWFPNPERPEGPQEGSLVEANFHRFSFQVDGGKAQARLKNWQLQEISINRPFSSEAALEAELKDLEQRFGPPDQSYPPNPSQPGAPRLVWSNTESTLTASCSQWEGKWVLGMHFER